ncbi:hypothetical protein D9611_013974 [Ephemerocybe angulata]|uniref:F-box domain-containing protein n=1 Tax=Ephemerocybe angulata TaxID=980116 RepID=A0A8H5ERH3_9AGAR|nr:hypothetical protein D9611_013974 [Tulosesus angulatus]
MSRTTPFNFITVKYPHLLSTNDPPSAAEEAKIREEMAAIQQDADLPEIQNQLATYRSVVSPVRRLPSEIIGNFLDLAARGHDGHIEKARVASFCLVSKAWRDSAIATLSLWRDVCIDRDKPLCKKVVEWLGRSGALTKTLRVELRDRGQQLCCGKHSRNYEAADNNPDEDEDNEAELEEEDDEDEDSDWSDDDSEDEDDEETPRECIIAKTRLAKLLVDGPQFNTLVLTVSSTWCLRELLRSIRTRARAKGVSWPGIPSLALRMVPNVGHWAETQDPSASLFKYLPSGSLSSLGLDLVLTDELMMSLLNLYRFNIPSSTLNSLTSLKIKTEWDGPQIARLLPHCERLEHLYLEYACPSKFGAYRWTAAHDFHTEANLPARIHLPKLRTLQVDGIPEMTVGTILHFIRAPALVNLGFQINMRPQWITVPPAEEESHLGRLPELFLQSLGLLPQEAEITSISNLHSLTMGDGKWYDYRLYLSRSTLASIAPHFNSLRHLILYEVKCMDGEDPFQALCHHMEQHQTHLLPNLEDMKLTFSDDSFPLESLFLFVKSRHDHWARRAVGHNQPRDSLHMVALRISDNWVNLANTYNTSPTIGHIRNLGVSVERY